MGAKNSAASDHCGRSAASQSCPTGVLLSVQFARGVGGLGARLRFVCSMPFVSQLGHYHLMEQSIIRRRAPHAVIENNFSYRLAGSVFDLNIHVALSDVLFLDADDAMARAGHCAVDENKVAESIHLHDGKPTHSDSPIAHMPCHLGARPDAPGMSGSAD